MDRIRELELKILRHKDLYYKGTPEISDIEYDNLEEELKKIDPSSYVFTLVGSLDSHSGEKRPHQTKMLSLDKTYDEKKLSEWIGNNVVISMLKIDGVSCSLIYDGGVLIEAKTRGDGKIGELINEKIFWINEIPKNISYMGKIEVRGELFCNEENFSLLSDEMEKNKLERPSSMRNIVAGLIGRKDHLELSRYLSFLAFDLIEEMAQYKTEVGKLAHLKSLNHPVVQHQLHVNQDEIKNVLQEVEDFIEEGNFQADGVVFIYNDLSMQRQLGDTDHHPRYKLAFKFQGEVAETIIENIEWSVSRNGILTPVAIVQATNLSGAEIRRVTLHNYGMLKAHKLKKMDRIEIVRSGEVIPKFLRVIASAEGDWEKDIPQSCPECGADIVLKEIRLFCSNKKCSARVKEGILNFIQKIGIDEISSQRLDEMIKKGLVKEIDDLYKLEEKDFLILDKVKETLSKKLYLSIQKKKKVDLKNFLAALGLNGGAYSKCEKVVNAGFDSLDKLKTMREEDLMNVDSFAEKSSAEFYQSLQEKWPLIDAILKSGVTVEKEKQKKKLQGLKFCITGSLSEKRSMVEMKIRELGGSVVSGVGKEVNYLVANEDSTSTKYLAAKKLNIPIIDEKKLSLLLEDN